MPNYDVILFDADNTLFDFDAAEHRALVQTLTMYGYPADKEAQNRYLALNRALWAAFDRGEVTKDFLLVERFAALGRALGQAADPAEMNRCYLSQLALGGDLLPGARALCRALSPPCTLAVITNGVSASQWGRFARSGLQPLIPHFFVSEDLGCQKPEKRFFDLTLNALGNPPRASVLVVGDSLSADIQGAINAGLDSVWYNPNRLPPTPCRPTYEAHSFDEISHLILGSQGP